MLIRLDAILGLCTDYNHLLNHHNNDLCLEMRFVNSFVTINPTFYYHTYLNSGLSICKAVYCYLSNTQGIMCQIDWILILTSTHYYGVVWNHTTIFIVGVNLRKNINLKQGLYVHACVQTVCPPSADLNV